MKRPKQYKYKKGEHPVLLFFGNKFNNNIGPKDLPFIIDKYIDFLLYFKKPVQPMNYIFAVLNTYTLDRKKSKIVFAKWFQSLGSTIPFLESLDTMVEIYFKLYPAEKAKQSKSLGN